AWTEALTAMQQQTIDGQENPINVIHSFKLHEPQEHLSLTRHTYAPAIIVMSLDRWNGLPRDAQRLLEEAAQEAAEYERQWNADMAEEQLEDLRANGMEIVEEPDIAAFQDAVAPVYDKYRDEFGDYLDRIMAELES
ncbi:MAG: TRAP transporter substrate-binding protein DctP, partial [Spirochaetaceae bacterium]